MRKIAITGGLASGKSSVCKILESYGAYVVSADEIVHQLLSSNTAVSQQVIQLLGSGILVGQGIDRKKIAEIVFTHREKLEELEAILHPAVYDEIERLYNQVKNQSQYRLFVAEIPLLYESNTRKEFFDFVAAVVADPEQCWKRYGSKEEYLKRMDRQLSQEEKAARADFTIVNNGDEQQLKNNVLTLFSKELHSQ